MPPLDRMHKIRHDIIKVINDYREKFEVTGLYGDIMGNAVANEYAEYLLENDEDETVLQQIKEKHHYHGEVTAIVGFSNLDEDAESEDKMLHAEFMDAHGLLTELGDELDKIVAPQTTHVGIGFAWNNLQVKLVELYSHKVLTITALNESEDNGIEARGYVLDKGCGIYAARICSAKQVGDIKKDIKRVGPQFISFNKQTKEFIVHIQGPLEDIFYSEDPKIVEFYVRKSQIDKIPYGEASTEAIQLQHLILAMRVPCEYIPDPRLLIITEQAMEKERKMMEARLKKEEEERILKQVQAEARKQQKIQMLAMGQSAHDDESVGGSSQMQSEKSGSKGSGMPGKTPGDSKSA